MKTPENSLMRRTLAALAAGLLLGGTIAQAEDMYRMPEPLSTAGGGVPASTIITPDYGTNSVTFSWYGMRGLSTIQASPDLSTWTNFASTMATAHVWSVTVTNPNPGAGSLYFRLLQSNGYVGADQCSSCHGSTYNSYLGTVHAGAYTNAYAVANFTPSCLTVGFGQQTGFTNLASTPTLANVGCENCHGPAGWHRGSDHAKIHPVVSIDPAICGSCHQGSKHPTFEEYSETLHSQVNDDLKYGFNNGVYYTNAINLNGTNVYGYYVTTNQIVVFTNGLVQATNAPGIYTNITTGIVNSLNGGQTNATLWYVSSAYDPGEDRQVGCGICHSGATRLAMLNDYEARQNGVVAPLSLPSGNDSAAWGPTCAICHDPHAVSTFSNLVMGVTNQIVGGVTNKVWGSLPRVQVTQLRNPTWSTNYYTMPTTADKRLSLVTNYNGSITTNYVFYGTTFANNYNPNINVCGQCHNTRGARWDGRGYGLFTNYLTASVTNIVATTIYTNYTTYVSPWTGNTITNYVASNTIPINVLSTNVATVTNMVVTNGLTFNTNGYSRPPHQAAQYNMLIGIVQPDYLTTNAAGVATNLFATHTGFLRTTPATSPYNTNQCVSCHMPSYVNTAGKITTGHTYEVDEIGCNLSGCHTSGSPTYQVTQAATRAKLVNLTALLNYWAVDQATNATYLGTSQYGVNGWEFTMPGNLAWINAGINGTGPSSTKQLKLPEAIRQARFNAYMIYSDGSYGVHNPGYTTLLFNDAENKVLNYYPNAAFKVKGNPYVATNASGASVAFTNCFAGATNFAWNFGDGQTTNTTVSGLSVTNKYALAGVYTVTLTATANGTNQTLSRTNYITIAAPPTVSFTSPAPAQTNTVVNFDGSASTGVQNYRWTFYIPTGAVTNKVFNYGPTAGYIFTNAGTYTVTLLGANIAGSVTVTNTVTITN